MELLQNVANDLFIKRDCNDQDDDKSEKELNKEIVIPVQEEAETGFDFSESMSDKFSIKWG